MARLTETVVVNCYGQTAEQFVIDANWRDKFIGYKEEQEAKKQMALANAEALRKFKEQQNGR